MTAREQAAGTPRTMVRGRSIDGVAVIVSDSRTRTIARFYGPTREADSELFMQAESERAAHAKTRTLLEEKHAAWAATVEAYGRERALSAELKERAEASEANAERLAAALEGLVRWAVGDKNMPAVMARESHPEHGETCALCIARAALAKARGEREV